MRDQKSKLDYQGRDRLKSRFIYRVGYVLEKLWKQRKSLRVLSEEIQKKKMFCFNKSVHDHQLLIMSYELKVKNFKLIMLIAPQKEDHFT